MNKEREITNCCVQSYLQEHCFCAKCIAVCFAIISMASCADDTGDSMFLTSERATNAYQTYLSEVRKEKSLSTDCLIEAINDWQTLRDSVLSCVARDSAIHTKNETTVHLLHDSLRTEFSRLVQSEPRTLTDVLLIREQTSRYRQDAELAQAVAQAEAFFDALDSIQPYQGSANQILSSYQSFLAKPLKSGLNDKEDLLTFIKEEDRLFHSFLVHLPTLADADLSAITQMNEKCCLTIFQSVENGRMSYQDALIYVAKRTNRRIIFNATVCIDDISQGKIKTETQARAYAWMLLQPYITIDSFGMAVLSDKERANLYEVAKLTPAMMTTLNQIIGTDNDQWQVLPEVLIEIMISSL